MRFRLDEAQNLYSQPELMAFTSVEIAAGEEVELARAVKRDGVRFHAIRRSNGQSGYIPADTRGSRHRHVIVKQPEVAVYFAPSAQSPMVSRLSKNSRIWMCVETIADGRAQFAAIHDASGSPGFIDARTRVKEIKPRSRRAARAGMAFGAVVFLLGAGYTVSSYIDADSNDGIFHIFVAPILIGGAMFCKGLGQLTSEPR